MLRERINTALADRYEIETIDDADVVSNLKRLQTMTGERTQLLSELTFIRVDRRDKPQYVTLLRNNAHRNMSSIFHEEKRLVPQENTVSVVKGLLGSYPNTLIVVAPGQLEGFVDQVLALTDEQDY